MNYLVVTLFAALLSCSTPNKPIDPNASAEKSTPAGAPTKPVVPQILPSIGEEAWKQSLTKNGQNDRAVFSRDGKKVLFISRDRQLHRQRQLWEINLETQQERRLTFQDGDVYEAVVSDEDGSIFYASTTDAIKERPILFYPELKNVTWPLTDIYRIKAGQNIHERWTDTPGFEGFLHVSSEAPGNFVITASRSNSDDLQLIRSSTSKPTFDVILNKPGLLLHSFTTNSKRKLKAWVEEERESGNSSIALSSKGQKPLLLKTALVEIRDVQILENAKNPATAAVKEQVDLIFSAKPQKGQTRQAYWMKLKENCIQHWMPMDVNVSDLRLSQDQKTVLWTQSQPNRSQVFLAALIPPTTPCEPAPAN